MKFVKTRGIALASAVALAASTLAACGANSSAAGGAQADPAVKVQVYPGTIWSVPVYAAQAEGFFRKEGLNASIVPENTGPAAIAALASGSVDIIFVSPEIVMGAVQKGLKAKVVGGTMANPWQILVSKNVKVPSTPYPGDLSALKNTTAGVPTIPSAGQAVLEASLGSAGIPASTVKATPVGLGQTALAALKSGQTQALITQEPTSQEAVKQLGAQVIADPRKGQIPDTLKGPYIGEWVSDATIKAHPDTVVKLRAALADAVRWLGNSANASAVAKLLQKTYNVQGLDYASMARADQSLWTTDYTESTLRTWVSYDVKYGFLSSSVPVNGLVWSGK